VYTMYSTMNVKIKRGIDVSDGDVTYYSTCDLLIN
jgi:hypothetical protein